MQPKIALSPVFNFIPPLSLILFPHSHLHHLALVCSSGTTWSSCYLSLAYPVAPSWRSDQTCGGEEWWEAHHQRAAQQPSKHHLQLGECVRLPRRTRLWGQDCHGAPVCACLQSHNLKSGNTGTAVRWAAVNVRTIWSIQWISKTTRHVILIKIKNEKSTIRFFSFILVLKW